MNVKQKQQLERYIKKLNITTDGELFVLEHILRRDWNRDIILISIEMIKYNHENCSNLVWVKCRTQSSCYDFSVGHIGTDGWITNSIDEQKSSVSGDLYHKLSR